MSEIPDKYTLGKGHVMFFYPRMMFLKKRYESLIAEMITRGYKPSFTDSSIFDNCPKDFFNDYTPTQEAIEINRQRIKERTKV